MSMIVAHRGASRDAPENTIPAFNLAWEQGADAIEGDFHQTREGVIVCIHDSDTERVAGTKHIVKNASLAELRALDVGAGHGNSFRGTVIPTIAEVLGTVPEHRKIHVEVKSGQSIVPKLIKEIETSNLRKEQVVVISFSRGVIAALKTKAPEFKALWLCRMNRDRAGNMVPAIGDVLDTLKQINADGFSSSKDMSDEAFVRDILAHGYEYHVWTVDDAETARRFKKWGALSITTNVPCCMRRNLDEPAILADADKPCC